ncbi:MAG: CDP-diacylglycerol--glycerol-3-phosphate 3-phosphatidyltransferase [Candidatus Omnitrophica bacterium]|nr:CDP-diacylglycerol--glycerol-3-phosphate 3-phosphatidyltransferase [Candidatus Omnitrophota bacterium]
MNLPNRLTLLRIALSFLLIVFLLAPGFSAKLLAVIAFTLASLTDLWDGRLARKKGMVTDFGILMDPIADKVLTLSAFLCFVQLGLAPVWMVVLIAAREFLVTGLRLFAMGRGHVLPAEAAGKHKTVSQMVAISTTLLFLLAREAFSSGAAGAGGGAATRWSAAAGAGGGAATRWSAAAGRWIAQGEAGIWWLMLVTTVLTLTSGISFLWKHRKLILSL